MYTEGSDVIGYVLTAVVLVVGVIIWVGFFTWTMRLLDDARREIE
jgi:cellobiose-specific phosphotransferase system component IIC